VFAVQKRSIGNIRNLGNEKYLLRLSAGFDDFGKRITFSKTILAKSEKEANIALCKFIADKDKLLEEKNTGIPETLGQLYSEWMKNHCEANLQDRSIQYYKDLWENHIKIYSKAKIKLFSAKMVYEILNNVKAGQRTKQGVYIMLNAMFNKAIQWEYMQINPCSRVDRPKYEAEEKKVYDENELEPILTAVNTQPLKYQAIFYFAVLCGIRRSEIVGLKWTDIDFKNNIFTIKRAATATKGKGTYEKPTKSKKSNRKLKLPEILTPILKSIRTEQLKDVVKLQELWHNEGWIFTKWNGEIMCVTTPTQWWIKFLKSNPALPKTNFHSLRHTLASLLIKKGVDVATLSNILGHAQKSTTMNIYAHDYESSKNEALTLAENTILKHSV
jgi:integrase